MANPNSTHHNYSSDYLPDARAQAVLSWVIKEHLVTGEPVGSRTVADLSSSTARWSPATIRNTMAELEEAGFLEQPHTSAGRVPTDKGYRFFVDHLITSKTRLTRDDFVVVKRHLETSGSELEPHKLMERVSHLLSQLSDSIGIVVAPPLARNALQHIEFVPLADKRVLVVLVFVPNIVQNKIIYLNEPLPPAELERTARYLNAEFSGKTLIQIRREILSLMREEKRLYDKLASNAMLLCEQSFRASDDASEEVFIDGTSKILMKPDFSDVNRLSELLRTLEEKSRLVEILNECLNQSLQTNTNSGAWRGDVRVRIGRENAATSMQHCTLVTASYRIGTNDAQGTIGIVGPMRIEYARTITLVNHIARVLEQAFNKENPTT